MATKTGGQPSRPTKKAAPKRPQDSRSVAVTGGRDSWGRLIVEALAPSQSHDRLVVLDHHAEPPSDAERARNARIHRVDLTEPTADARLIDVFTREGVDTVLHAAFVRAPGHEAAAAHELEVIGTLYVLNACAAAGVRKLVYLGSTMSYGAHPQNPNFLTESHPLRGADGFQLVQDRLEAEAQVRKFAERYPEVSCTVLRLAPIVGPGLENLWSHYLRQPLCPTVLGFDPLMQFVHVQDALRAIRLAVREPHEGTFNIVGRGVLPLSTVLRIVGAMSAPLPRSLAHSLVGAAWGAKFVDYPPQLLDYLTYSWVADGEKAAQQLGFIPQYGVREALEAFAGSLAAPESEPLALTAQSVGGAHG